MIRHTLLTAAFLLLGSGTADFAALAAQRPTVSPRVSTPRPAPRVSTPRVSTPRVSTPRVTTPRVSAPRPSTPRITTPRVTTPRISTPRITTPRITTPRITTPRITTPRVSNPRVTTPRITTPRVTTPRITTPRVTTPSIGSPRITTPRVTTPRVTTPSIGSPRVTSPGGSLAPRYRTPSTSGTPRVNTLPRAIGGSGSSSSGTRSRLHELYERRNATTRQPAPAQPRTTTGSRIEERYAPRVRERVGSGPSNGSGGSGNPPVLRQEPPTRVSAGGGSTPRAGNPRVAAPRPTEPRTGSPRTESPRIGAPRNGGGGGTTPTLRPVAGERYRVAGRPVASPRTPAPTPRVGGERRIGGEPRIGGERRGGGSNNNSGTTPRLRQRSPISVGTPVRPTLRNGPSLNDGPRLNGPRTGGFGSRFGNDTYWNHGYRYRGSSWIQTNRFLNGCYHWSGHFGAFNPWRYRWGAYCYPYLHCGTWWDYYWGCRSSFVLSWNSWAPQNAAVSWWWPNGCYVPGTWLGFGLGYGYGSGLGAVDWGYVPSSTVVVQQVVDGGAGGAPAPAVGGPVAGGEAVVAGELGGAAAAAAPEGEGEAAPARRHLNLGDYYFRQGRYDEAAESYLRALAYAPDDGTIHFVIADALFAQGDYHYAAYMIGKALELDPALAEAEADKHSFYGDPEDFDRQLDVLRKYLTEKPYDAAAHLVLGYNLRFGGEPELAVRAFSKALEIDPGNRAARAFLEAAAKPEDPAAPAEKAPGAAGAKDAGAAPESGRGDW